MTEQTPRRRHLWEYDHPYQCAEAEQHTSFSSWEQFAATDWHTGDPDRNLLIRWDWRSWQRHPDPGLRDGEPDQLLLHFVLQRKALLHSVTVTVTDTDEPRVRQYLAERATTITAIWEPVALTAPAPPA